MNTAREDYIRAIYLLNKRIKESILKKDLGKFMGLAKSTVSERIKSLIETGYVKDIETLELTNKGKKLAEKLTYKHRLIEVFLHQVLEMDESELHEEADKLEHAFSDKVISKLRIYLNDPKKCPHGGNIN
ncbi:MAG: metal-dependent transcriptional regulator [Nanoarchaeota archaeon]